MSVLEVEGMEKSYVTGFWRRKQKVLNGVSFKVQPGVVTGFLGGNGAGKTTTLKCLLGLCQLNRGEVSFFGGQKLSSKVRARIGFLPERPYFYEYLTGMEFLKFYGQMDGKYSLVDLKERIHRLLGKVDLMHAKDKPLRSYSKGMLQKIGLAQSLIHAPDLIILDEPMAGLDPDGRYYLSEIIKETAEQGTAVFFSSHLLHDTEKLCKNLVILKEGVVEFEGTTEQFLFQLGSETEIVFSESLSGQRKSRGVSSSEEVQSAIDELRAMGHIIHSVHVHKKSLEEAFIELAMDHTKAEKGQPRLSIIQIIAINTYREIIRDRILYGLLIFAVFLIGVSLALGQLTFDEQTRISVNFGFTAIHLSVMIISIFVGCTLVSREIEKKTILTILVRPITKTQFIVGKYMGLLLVILTMVIGLSLILNVIFWQLNKPMDLSFWVGVYGIFLESCIILAVTILLSCFTRPIMVVTISIGFFLVGHWVDNLKYFSEKSASLAFYYFGQVVRYAFPNLDWYNWRSIFVYSHEIPWNQVGLATLSVMAWGTIFILGATWILEKKDFN